MADIFEIGIERLKKEQRKDETNNCKLFFPLPHIVSFSRLPSAKFRLHTDAGRADLREFQGKSTFINRFLDQTQNTSPTFGLCYTFATRTRLKNKDLANFWELGNGGLTAQLVSNCLHSKNVSLAVVLFLNLTEPQAFESVVRPLVDAVKNQVETAKQGVRNAKTPAATPDGCFPIGVLLTIVGSHYDEFQNFDTEKKRNIIRLLRFLAHINGASLQMYSIHQEPLVSRGKTLLSQFGFGTSPSKAISLDIHKPVFVPAFGDSLDEIGSLIEGRSRPVFASHHEAMEIFYGVLNELFKQEFENQQAAVNVDNESKQFAEPLIDVAIEERYRELEFLMRENRSRSQL